MVKLTNNIIQHPVPSEHLTQIGDITVSFALLEFVIKSLIWSFVSTQQRIGQIITAEVSFKNIRALALSLYLELNGEDEKYFELKKLMNSASKVEERRNQIIHSIWGAGKDINHITRLKTSAKESKGLQFNFEQLSIDDLKGSAKEIKQVAAKIQQFMMDLIFSPKHIIEK